MSMLLCDFHIHITWSDGSVALPENVDIYGQAGFDVYLPARYEIVFCVQGASDPALRVARRVKILCKPLALPMSRPWKPRAGRIYNFPIRRVVEEK